MDKGAEEDELAEGAEEAEGAEKTDVSAIYIYIVIWLEHYGNRLYDDLLGLLSKMSMWVTGYPFDCYD